MSKQPWELYCDFLKECADLFDAELVRVRRIRREMDQKNLPTWGIVEGLKEVFRHESKGDQQDDGSEDL